MPKTVVLQTRAPSELAARLHTYMEDRGLSQSDALREIIELGLDKSTLTEVDAQNIDSMLETRLAEIEERLIRTSSRGTKASLATLIGLVTLLPANANLTSATYNITHQAWSKLGMYIEDQRVDPAENNISDWSGCEPADFFKFCWDAGGKAQSKGQQVDYGSIIKSLKSKPDASQIADDIPSYIIEAISDEDYLASLYGKEFSQEWQTLRERKLKRDSHTEDSDRLTPVQRDLRAQDIKKYNELKQKIMEGARLAIHRTTAGEVVDLDHPTLWREKDVCDLNKENDSSPFDTFVSSCGGVDAAKKYLVHCLEEGYSLPDSYDGRWDEDIYNTEG